MNKKVMLLENLKNILEGSKKQKRYYTMKEKREMALNGEEVPLCLNLKPSRDIGIVPIRHVPNSHLAKLKLKFK